MRSWMLMLGLIAGVVGVAQVAHGEALKVAEAEIAQIRAYSPPNLEQLYSLAIHIDDMREYIDFQRRDVIDALHAPAGYRTRDCDIFRAVFRSLETAAEKIETAQVTISRVISIAELAHKESDSYGITNILILDALKAKSAASLEAANRAGVDAVSLFRSVEQMPSQQCDVLDDGVHRPACPRSCLQRK